MFYHAITDFDNTTRYWWNRTRDELIDELLTPLLSKQIVAVIRRGKQSLFNFGAVSYITIVKSENKLERPAKGLAPSELKDQSFVDKHNSTEEFINEVRILQSAPSSRSLLQKSLT